MANKKIGAVIALDGEKEFKQSVTNCNKTLASLKSEMELVQAESDGQANSLESLQKKHNVLGRVLDEQVNKQEAVTKGLEHAQQSQEKVKKGLEELNDKYSDAVKALDEMRESSDATDDQLQEQEKVVKELHDAIEKGEKNYKTAGERVQEWETKLNSAKAEVIKANRALDENASYMKEAEKSTDKCADSIDEFGNSVKEATEVTKSMGEIVKENLVNSATDAMKNMVSNAFSSVTELEDASRQLQASIGLSNSEMKEYQATLEKIYNNNYGDSLESVANSLGMVKQYSGETDPTKLQELTESAIALEDVFGMDLKESIRGVDALMRNMGLSSEEAFDYIAKGAQNGLDKSGELAYNTAEYSQLWSQAGFSAQEMFSILQNGLDSGAYNLDKVNDFVKEFTISMADGRIEENISSFSEGTKNLFYAWQNGKVSAKEVFSSVIDDLGTMTNKQEALTLASNVWSALGEDNAMSVITSLNKVNNTYDDVKGTMESVKDIKYDSLTNKWEELARKFKTEIAKPLSEDFLPYAESAVEKLTDNIDLMVPVISGVGTALAGIKIASVFGEAMTPVTLLGSAMAGAAVAFGIFAENAGDASQKVTDLAESNDRAVESAGRVTEAASETIKNYSDTVYDVQAKSEYAVTLADRIENLASKTGRSNAETAVMKEYISQLNELVPGLNLAYDEQTKSLSMTNEEIKNYISNSKSQLEVQAAQKYYAEIIQNRMDLEIEELKLQNQYKDLYDERKKLTEDMSEAEYNQFVQTPAWMLSGDLQDRKASYDELTDSISENSTELERNRDAQKESEEQAVAIKEKFDALGIEIDLETGKITENTDAYDAQAAAAEEAAARRIAAQEEWNSYMQQATDQFVQQTQEQISMFSKATNLHGEELQKATEETLQNMQSQAEAMTNWADNLQIIMNKGINEGLLKYLADMGPQGAEYVAQFAAMTDEQIKIANDTWGTTMEETGIGAKLAGSITGEIEEMAEEIKNSAKPVGTAITDGTSEGIDEGKKDVVNSTNEMAEASIEASKTTYDSHSPSRVMQKIGNDASQGLANGILEKVIQVATNAKVVALAAVNNTEKYMPRVTFYDIGKNIPDGLSQGILAGRSKVVNSVASLCESAIRQAKKTLDINSPSKVFEELGDYSAQGYGIGFENKMAGVRSSINAAMKFSTRELSPIQSEWNLTDTIENALYNGMIYAMSKNGQRSGGTVNVTLNIDGQKIADRMIELNNEYINRNGNSMF